ncbi:uncharacterized protein K460DRAFT_301200 [Cucurbitaria berberidis CBS 394.84]|uniref:Uncharacterized protein n=1 Tax=Cucurbitaria berberidis CBS 394.84 TaxID=1168544 RepID=A0A9P4LDP4_9PLEO|nr:uncharacterized protein K460DRAFT_301200 [Cucurbitaria berberidis CBS 394.84]KAF1850309.1 hypothetical protein K460DRAFT_301200 [Cucurbitaria berberidis CBS 394.84]
MTVATIDLPLPPLSSHISTDVEADAEAATQQLLEESQGSATKPRQPKPSSAALGASLLNAARIQDRQSTSGGMAPKAGAGKLKRISRMTTAQAHTDYVRRGNAYDLLLSPEKGAFRLPEMVNHQPLKITRKKRKVQYKVEGQQLSSGQLAPHRDEARNSDTESYRAEANNEPQLPSSPPEFRVGSIDRVETGAHIRKRQSTHDSAPEDVHIDEYLSNGKLRCTVVLYRNDSKGPYYQQCSLAGTNRTDVGLRCHVHMRKPTTVRCGAVTDQDDLDSQCRAPAQNETVHGPRCTLHADTPGKQYAPSKSKKERDSNAPSRKSHPQVQIPVRQRSRQKPTKGKTVDEFSGDQQSEVTETIAVAAPKVPAEGKRTSAKKPTTKKTASSSQSRSSEKQKTKDSAKVSKEVQPVRETASIHSTPLAGEAGTGDLDADEQELDSDEDEDEDKADDPVQLSRLSALSDIDQVFQFLDVEERAGKCQTELGTTIKRACERSCELVQSEDISVDDIIDDFQDLQSVLKQVTTDVSESDQLSFKSDAYGYIFRGLTAYLQVVYLRLGEKYDSIDESLEALRILSPLTHEVLAFKDTIAKWNASVPQRYKGDRIVKEVESKLIAPLRRLDKSFRVQLHQLEATDRQRQMRAELERKRQEELDEEQRVRKAIAMSNARWSRWQDLHIARMLCEPDWTRRRHLEITSLPDMEEKDANGVRFERVPVFRARSTLPLPLHWAFSMSEEQEWTEEEELVLFEALMSFAGPDVFEKIFRAHCGPGCVLRDYNVKEIIAKSAWKCKESIHLHQDKGWPVPAWVKHVQNAISKV